MFEKSKDEAKKGGRGQHLAGLADTSLGRLSELSAGPV